MSHGPAEPTGDEDQRGGYRSTHVLRFIFGVAVAVAVGVFGVVLFEQASGATQRSATQEPSADPLVVEGRELFVTGCSSCHGINGMGLKNSRGQVQGPDLTAAGEASAYFYLHTGRMPLNAPDAIPVSKEPAYDEHDIDALVAYVGSLGVGPAIPAVDTKEGDLADGGVIFRQQCQACHSATGAGGALSYGRNAPPLSDATATEVGTAIRIGPGQMPRFGSEVINDQDLNSLAAYVEYLRKPDDAGGVSLGRLGPIPEGFLIWVLGIGGLLLVAVWISKGRMERRR